MKIIVFFGEGFEEVEALATVDVLRRGGLEVLMAGVNQREVKSARGICIKMDCLANEVNYEEVSMIVLPGGLGGVNELEKSDLVKEVLKEFHTQKKWIGAICAAPSLLGKYGLLKGVEATCYPGMEKSLLEAKYVNQAVVKSGHFITGKGVGVSLEFGLALLSCFKDNKTVNDLKKAMII